MSFLSELVNGQYLRRNPLHQRAYELVREMLDARWNEAPQPEFETRGDVPHDGEKLCPPESRCTECYPVETTVLHEGVRQSYLKACELSLASGLLGDGDRSDLLELYKSLWPKAPSDIREKALMQPVEARETSAEPARVLQWAVDSFGEIARNRDERAARLAEEAMEVAQAEGVPLETLKRIADRIYSRPMGELGQEVGGLGITLYALAANCGLDLFDEIEREWKRVLSKPRDWWRRKHAEKVAAGTADLSPITPEEPECSHVGVQTVCACIKCGVVLETPKGFTEAGKRSVGISPEKAGDKHE
jgi:NTP pyrophosphatase (non-canonical NTP hydrolase)